jgi:acetyl-CoA carboxylase biotin carboxyl carrier protein
VDVNLGDIQALLRAVQDTDVAELILESGDFKLTIRKPAGAISGGVGPIAIAAPPRAEAPAATAPFQAPPAVIPAPVTPSMPTTPEATPARPALTVNAPMVGTFYRSPSPDANPFVDVGDVVKPGQTVCIIEAMKLMNELESEVSGRVVRFLVENGEPVEFGQPLIALEPV